MAEDPKPEKKPKPISAKQKAFVAEYLLDRNATQAALRAGYAESGAATQGARLLINAKVARALELAIEEQQQRTLVSADWVILAVKEVAERCMQRVPVMEFDHVNKEMVQATAREVCECGKKRDVGIWEFDSAGALGALKLLGPYAGAWGSADGRTRSLSKSRKLTDADGNAQEETTTLTFTT